MPKHHNNRFIKFIIPTRTTTMVGVTISGIFGALSNAFATPAIADLWTAFDISTINSQVLTILTTFVTINLAFVAYKYIRKTMGRG